MLLLLLLQLQNDGKIHSLVSLSPLGLKGIADELGMKNSNLLASLTKRRPMISGDRFNGLAKLLRIDPVTCALDNHQVHYWHVKEKTLPDLKDMTKAMFPGGCNVTNVLFSDSSSSTTTCLWSEDYVCALNPYPGLKFDWLKIKKHPTLDLPVTFNQFQLLPADKARGHLYPAAITWDDVVESCKQKGLSPQKAMNILHELPEIPA